MVVEIMKGLNQFFSQFGTAYIETSVPESAEFPYITYKCGSEDWNNKALISCSIYSKSSSYVELSEIAEKILDSVRDGAIISVDGGYLCIYLGEPEFQIVPNTDYNIRQGYINFVVHCEVR